MSSPISSYKSIIFDCDGVILDSNKVKTDAFYEVTKHFGHEAASALVQYHTANGGISRYLKFQYFLEEILGQPFEKEILDDLLARFSREVKDRLMTCKITKGLDDLKAVCKEANWLIVSGGDQNELREIFSARDLNQYFDGGIFGSPDKKDDILKREIASGRIRDKALFLGDSKYDFEVANNANMDFVFISQWTEVQDYDDFCRVNNIKFVKSVCDINDT